MARALLSGGARRAASGFAGGRFTLRFYTRRFWGACAPSTVPAQEDTRSTFHRSTATPPTPPPPPQVFAPDNRAFEALPPGVLPHLLANKTLLDEILTCV